MELLQKLLTCDPSSTSTVGSSSIPQKGLQGEISGNSNQDQFWDIALPAHIAHPATNIALPAPVFESTTSTAPVTSGNSSPRTTVVPFESDSAPNLPAASTLEL
ncbi:hypothetical protein CK203_029162 [Vitis vinifera]|uniref:Uncharacterized protein n=1 Tax=Vitis vinifera TaxID=29760 RepID=A0A438ISY0_VITVI|nr:hypothetical protein CK203_029162 [Vitis vinifera]